MGMSPRVIFTGANSTKANKLLKALKTVVLLTFLVKDIFFLNINLIEKIRGVENALNEAHAVQLKCGSASNMDPYSYSSPSL